MALISMVAGVIGLLMVGSHIVAIVALSPELEGQNNEEQCKFMLGPQQNRVLVIIIVPAIFAVLALGNAQRMLKLMSGLDCEYADLKLLRSEMLALNKIHMQVGAAAQFLAVWAYSRLCTAYHHLNADPDLEDFKFVHTWAGSQGIHAYVIVGLATCMLRLVEAYCSFYNHASAESEAFNFLEARMEPVLSFATVLCVYNMFILSKTRDLIAALGTDVNLKFLATRLLLLIAQIQPIVLNALVNKSTLCTFLTEHPSLSPYRPGFVCSISKYQSDLANASLLGYECLVLILFDRYFWNAKFISDILHKAGNVATLRAGLIEKGAAENHIPEVTHETSKSSWMVWGWERRY